MSYGETNKTGRAQDFVIIRDIERRKIVDDDTNRQDFVSRMGRIATETETSIC